MTNLLLFLHVVSGLLFFVSSFSDYVKSQILNKSFVPSFVATSVTGLGLVFSGSGVTAVCVRFLVMSVVAFSIKALGKKYALK